MTIDKDLKSKKIELLKYFRDIASTYFETLNKQYKTSEFKTKAREVNRYLGSIKSELLLLLITKAKSEEWTNKELLECILMITYTNYIVMIESRNDVWKYEYMTFSRRVGELWEPFCKLCFYHPINDIRIFEPPKIQDVKKSLRNDIEAHINSFNISDEDKEKLKTSYSVVWALVTSGEIKLELDLHFEYNNQKFVVDFKSGFGSNEKGNTNRLLLVGNIYKSLPDNYRCLIFVRSTENNSYFRTLKNSEQWETFCGSETYDKIKEYSGYDIKRWIETNVNWETDLESKTLQFLKDNNLTQYLKW